MMCSIAGADRIPRYVQCIIIDSPFRGLDMIRNGSPPTLPLPRFLGYGNICDPGKTPFPDPAALLRIHPLVVGCAFGTIYLASLTCNIQRLHTQSCKPPAILNLLVRTTSRSPHEVTDETNDITSISCASSLADLLTGSLCPGSLLWEVRRFDTFWNRGHE